MILNNTTITLMIPEGAYVDGIYGIWGHNEVKVKASVQPLSNKDKQATLRGDVETQRVKAYLPPGIVLEPHIHDQCRFVWNHRTWIVESIEYHQGGLMPHTKLIAVMKEQNHATEHPRLPEVFDASGSLHQPPERTITYF